MTAMMRGPHGEAVAAPRARDLAVAIPRHRAIRDDGVPSGERRVAGRPRGMRARAVWA